MQHKKLTIITVSVVLIYLIVIVVWQLSQQWQGVTLQAPGLDNRPEGSARAADEVRIGEHFMKYEEVTTTLTGSWRGFRGGDLSNTVTEQIEIPTEDYPVEWTLTASGEGHAAPAIYRGRVYLLDYDETLSSDMLRCLSLETGKELWRRWYRVPMKRNHGFSRTIPAVGDGYVATIGPEGHVMVCNPETGDLLWTLDMKKEFTTEVPFWYTGQCPLVDNGVLVVAPAGDSILMMGLDVTTGEVLWRAPNTVKYKMSHSSIVPMTINGRYTYVYMGIGGVCGVSPEGRILWSADKWQPSVIAPSALQIAPNKILLVAGYGAGGALLAVSGGTATVIQEYRPNEGLASEQQTPILFNRMIISVLPKDGGSSRSKLVYYSADDLQNAVWSSAAEERFGLGPYMIIGGKLFVFKDDGELYVYQVEPRSMKLLKQQRVMDGVDAWGPMAYADGRLIVRDAHTIKCLRIK